MITLVAFAWDPGRECVNVAMFRRRILTTRSDVGNATENRRGNPFDMCTCTIPAFNRPGYRSERSIGLWRHMNAFVEETATPVTRVVKFRCSKTGVAQSNESRKNWAVMDNRYVPYSPAIFNLMSGSIAVMWPLVQSSSGSLVQSSTEGACREFRSLSPSLHSFVELLSESTPSVHSEEISTPSCCLPCRVTGFQRTFFTRIVHLRPSAKGVKTGKQCVSRC